MSTSVDTAFVTQFEQEVHEAFQRQSSKLRDTIRLKTGVVGSSTTFQVVGTGTATTKARHGVITPMNAGHTAVPCTVADFYAGDWVDKLDELKINIDERMVVANAGAYALGRKIDSQVFYRSGRHVPDDCDMGCDFGCRDPEQPHQHGGSPGLQRRA